MKNSFRFIQIAVITVMLASNSAYAIKNSFLSNGEAKLKSGHNKEAIADFTKAIEHNPKHAKSDLSKAYCHRGIAERAIGEIGAADSDFQKAIELDPTPKDAMAFNNRGIAKSALGDINGAKSDFQMANSLRDDSTQDEILTNNG
jgi:tetratricopeptide (TPR) repeat protein